MTGFSSDRFNLESQIFANIITMKGADFTIAEADHWVQRLSVAHRADFVAWHEGQKS